MTHYGKKKWLRHGLLIVVESPRNGMFSAKNFAACTFIEVTAERNLLSPLNEDTQLTKRFAVSGIVLLLVPSAFTQSSSASPTSTGDTQKAVIESESHEFSLPTANLGRQGALEVRASPVRRLAKRNGSPRLPRTLAVP
jgi:hypothetical protein